MQLSARQLSLLLDEVTAMVQARRSLVDGVDKLDIPSLGKIGRAARQISKNLQSGQNPEAAFTEIAGAYGPQVSAALATLQTTGSTIPITRLTQWLRRQSDLKTTFIVAMIYPLLTALIAYLVITLGVTTLIISHWRMDVTRLRVDNVWLQPCIWLQANFWWPPLIAFSIFMVYQFVRRRGWFMCGMDSKLDRHIACSKFCDLLAVQLDFHATLTDSLPIAAQASGDPSLANKLPPMVGWLLDRAAQVPLEETTDQLRSLAQWYHDDAVRRGRFWIEWFPTIVTVCTGLIAASVYWLVVLRPLYDGFCQVAK